MHSATGPKSKPHTQPPPCKTNKRHTGPAWQIVIPHAKSGLTMGHIQPKSHSRVKVHDDGSIRAQDRSMMPAVSEHRAGPDAGSTRTKKRPLLPEVSKGKDCDAGSTCRLLPLHCRIKSDRQTVQPKAASRYLAESRKVRIPRAASGPGITGFKPVLRILFILSIVAYALHGQFLPG